MTNVKIQNNCKVATFPAPTGDYREIVLGYMMKMAQVKWTPDVDMNVVMKKSYDYKAALEYKAGVTYYGMPYTDTKCGLDAFEQFVKDGVFSYESHYFDDLIGNHCSSSMARAFQQLISNGNMGGTKPQKSYAGIFKFPNDIKIPYELYGDAYDSFDIWNHNSKAKIYEAYGMMKPGDVIYFSKKTGSGHVRMVSQESIIVYDEYGMIDGEKSEVIVIEQTNTWDKTVDIPTTWFVNRHYSFDTLYEKHFMPITLEIYSNGEKSKDAYIIYDGENNADTIKNGVKGTVTCTFPLDYAYATIKDKDGKVVRKSLTYNVMNKYNLNLEDMNADLDIATLPSGTYTFKYRVAIARGGVDFESFEFTV
ncbi:MAG: hypothetical protein IJ292_00140 [Clostridia bacterium]|nr:hypothetical protein [Clostridia bacterium]